MREQESLRAIKINGLTHNMLPHYVNLSQQPTIKYTRTQMLFKGAQFRSVYLS
jgi:hypothetical protein